MVMLERRILGGTSMLVTVYFVCSCVGLVPGFPAVGYLPAIIVVLIAALEFFKPWRGFYIYLLFWPVMLLVKELLVKSLGPHWNSLPEFWGWPLAAALAVGCWLRFERLDARIASCDTKVNDPAHVRNIWIRAFRICLWGLLLAFLISYLAAMSRLHHPPADWVVHPNGQQEVLDKVVAYMPSIILGLLLLNYNAGLTELPIRKMMFFSVIGGVLAAFFFIYQWKTGTSWSFNGSQHAGTFGNRNTAAPFFVVIGTISFVMTAFSSRRKNEVLLLGLGVILFYLAVKTGSRNSLIMIFAFLSSLFLMFAGWKTFALTVMSCFLVFFFAPTTIQHDVIDFAERHTLTAVELLKADDPGTYHIRRDLWNASLHLFREYPFTGSGPGTFYMATTAGARYAGLNPHNYYAAHSMPFNLLAETGLQGMLSWSASWIVLPLLALTRRGKKEAFAVPVLVMGLGNLVDTVWMSTGMTTFCILIIVWLCVDLSEPDFKKANP